MPPSVWPCCDAVQPGCNATWLCQKPTQTKQTAENFDVCACVQSLMTKPYAQQAVLCPHVYGPAVTHSNQGATGQGLFQRLTASFGALTQAGFPGSHSQQVHHHAFSHQH